MKLNENFELKIINTVRSHRIFLAILLLGIFLVFFRITRHDMDGDGAFYSLRSVGYLDYLASDQQSTPIQWFGKVPWWGWLSFHDHPPLVFFINHVFFRIFGDSIFVARLPTALFSVGSIILLYLITLNKYDKITAILASVYFSLSTFFIWTSRMTYLEGIEIFFILLAFFAQILCEKNSRFFLLLGAAAGLALLTKYTSAFILPAVFASLFFTKSIQKPDSEKMPHRSLFGGIMLFFVVIAPIVIYNFMMFRTRGHFDVQISHIVPNVFENAKKDWSLLFQEKVQPNFAKNFFTLWDSLRRGYSLPFFVLLTSGFFGFIFIVVKNFRIHKHSALFFWILFLVLEFTFISPSVRYVPILTPFLAMALAVSARNIFEFAVKFFHPQKIFIVFVAIFFPMIFLELLYNYFTNHALRSPRAQFFWSKELRRENIGFQELEEYLKNIFASERHFRSSPQQIFNKEDIALNYEDAMEENIYLYDHRINWYSAMWHLERYNLFHNINIINDVNLMKVSGFHQNWFEILERARVADFYYIKGAGKDVFLEGSYNVSEKRRIAEFIEKQILPYLGTRAKVEKIFNSQGELAFLVYRIVVNK